MTGIPKRANILFMSHDMTNNGYVSSVAELAIYFGGNVVVSSDNIAVRLREMVVQSGRVKIMGSCHDVRVLSMGLEDSVLPVPYNIQLGVCVPRTDDAIVALKKGGLQIIDIVVIDTALAMERARALNNELMGNGRVKTETVGGIIPLDIYTMIACAQQGHKLVIASERRLKEVVDLATRGVFDGNADQKDVAQAIYEICITEAWDVFTGITNVVHKACTALREGVGDSFYN